MLGDDGLRELVESYVDAWQRGDVEAVVAKLAEDATFAMPPLASYFQGPEDLLAFLAEFPLSGPWRWKPVMSHANGQPALGFFAWDENERAYLPFALNVVTFRGREISDVIALVVRSIEPTDDKAYHRWVDQPADERRLVGVFGSFGLPDRLAD